MSCRTPWCYGDCDDCEADKKLEEEYKDSIAECPHKKECSFEMINVKTDRCTTCGKNFNY